MPVFRRKTIAHVVRSSLGRHRGNVVRFARCAVISPAALMLFGNGAIAQDQTSWTGEGTGSDWAVEDNWSDGIPDETVEAVIREESDGSVPEVRIETGEVSAGGLELRPVEDADTQHLLVTGDATLTTGESGGSANVGLFGGVTASAAVSGEEAAWIHESLNFNVGTSGPTGSLRIDDGARLSQASGSMFVGNSPDAEGRVVVTGSLSQLEGASVAVGQRGEGSLEIRDGAEVFHDVAYVGRKSDSDGRVRVEAGQWFVDGSLVVGEEGTGEVSILEGGEVESARVIVGSAADSEGQVTVAGGGTSTPSLDVDGPLTIGGEGVGGLAVEDSGEATVAGATWVGHEAGGQGELLINGGRFTADDEFHVGDAGDGLVSLAESGSMEANEFVHVGSQAGSTGRLEVGDSSDLVVTGQGIESVVGVGVEGDGEMDILDGSTVESGVGSVGAVESGVGQVRVARDSAWNVDHALFVGDDGDGELVAEDGATIRVSETDGEMVLGHRELGAGRLDARGSETEIRVPNLGVGEFGEGELSLDSGAAANVSNEVAIGLRPDSVGRVTLAGSDTAMDVDGDLVVGLYGKALLEVGEGSEAVTTGEVTIGGDGSAVVNGVLQSDGMVRTSGTGGGLLMGDGLVRGGAVIADGGTLAPGNSIGSFSIETGDLLFEDGATFQVEVDDAGNAPGVNNDHVAVTGGDIVIDEGATVHVTPENGSDDGSTYAPETTYTILETDQAVDGQFGEVMDDFAFLLPELAYGSSTVELTLTQVTDIAEAARTPNERSVAAALDEQELDGAMAPVLEPVLTSSEKGARNALNDLSGVHHAHAQQVVQRVGQRFRGGLMRRMDGRIGSVVTTRSAGVDGLDGLKLASVGQPAGLVDDRADSMRGWWVDVSGGRGDIDDTSKATGADYHFGGVTVGADAPLSEALSLGIALGYDNSDVDTAAGSIDTDSLQLAAYGGWQQGARYVRGTLGVGYHDMNSDRRVTTLDRTARSDYSAWGVGASVEGGHAFALRAGTTLTPFAGLDYQHLHRDGYTEDGAGAADLDVDSENEYSLRGRAGARMAHVIDRGGANTIMPYAELAWVHEFGDRASSIDTAFDAAPGSRFGIDGPALDRDRLHLGAGVEARVREDGYLQVGYEGEVASSDDNHALFARFRQAW